MMEVLTNLIHLQLTQCYTVKLGEKRDTNSRGQETPGDLSFLKAPLVNLCTTK